MTTPAPNKSKVAIIIIAIVIVLLLAVYFSGRNAAKNKAALKNAADKWGKDDWGAAVQSNSSQIPAGWQPDGLAKELFDVMDGVFTASSTKEKVWAKLTALTDGQVIEVYKRFSERFAKKPDTLTTWIKDEANGDNTAALAVLSKLNLP